MIMDFFFYGKTAYFSLQPLLTGTRGHHSYGWRMFPPRTHAQISRRVHEFWVMAHQNKSHFRACYIMKKKKKNAIHDTSLYQLLCGFNIFLPLQSECTPVQYHPKILINILAPPTCLLRTKVKLSCRNAFRRIDIPYSFFFYLLSFTY